MHSEAVDCTKCNRDASVTERPRVRLCRHAGPIKRQGYDNLDFLRSATPDELSKLHAPSVLLWFAS